MYKQILLPIDLNDPSHQEKALQTATALAKAFGAGLHVMAIVPDFGIGVVGGFFPEDYEAKAKAATEKALDDYVKTRVPKGIAAKHSVTQGTIYEEILDTAQAIGADLIIMASHRPALKDYLLGPNAAKVMRHAHCSVMVVRSGES